MAGPNFNGNVTVVASGTEPGNVGIGTTSPDVGLDVETGVGSTFGKFGADLASYLMGNWPGLGFNAYHAGGGNWVYGARPPNPSEAYAAVILLSPFTGDIRFYTAGLGTTGPLNNFSQRVTIDKDGNVGIGTPTPGEKLEVNGNVKVAGKGTFGGETTQGLAIGNGRIFAFADQGNPSRLDIANGVVQIIGDAPDVNGGVYIRIKSAAEGGQGAFRVRNMGNTVDMLRVTAAGEVYVNEVKAINAQGQCLYG